MTSCSLMLINERLNIERSKNESYEKQIADLQTAIEKKQTDVKIQTEKINGVEKQLANARRERLAAIKRLQIRQLDAQINELTRKVEERRPTAAVEPFLHKVPVVSVPTQKYLHSRGFKAAFSAFQCVLLDGIVESVGEPACRRKEHDEPPPDIIPLKEKESFGHCASLDEKSHTMASSSNAQFIDTDKIAIRNDTLRAAKRRSWADSTHHNIHHYSENNVQNSSCVPNEESEIIKGILFKEQQKGRSSVSLSWIFNQLSHNANQTSEFNKTDDIFDGSVVSDKQPEMLQNTSEPGNERDDVIGHLKETDVDSGVPVDQSILCPTINDNITNIYIESNDEAESDALNKPEFFIESMETQKIRGILKDGRDNLVKRCSKYRIRFDPLTLLLDAALEGELDLVKKCAADIKNVNVSNAEGITALHNAICAGHFEIIHFLIEQGADTNAQDIDGWTPLHCAASCNNLPTVKFLIENGACPFSQTLTDSQTPLEKCEEDAQGFDGCFQYLKSIEQKMGLSINSGKVYSAFDREPSCFDEISVKKGDELVVIDRDLEPGWWLVKNEKNLTTGLIPLTYLAIYRLRNPLVSN